MYKRNQYLEGPSISLQSPHSRPAQARPAPWAHHLHSPIQSDENTGNNIIIPTVLEKNSKQ